VSTHGGEEPVVVVDSHWGREAAVRTISFYSAKGRVQGGEELIFLHCGDTQVRPCQQHRLMAVGIQTWKE